MTRRRSFPVLRTGWLGLVVVALAFGVTGLAAPVHASGVSGAADSHPKRTAVLTPDQGDRYTVTSGASGVVVRAPASNVGGNLRMVFWPHGALATTNGQTCASWISERGGSVQQGAALRLKLWPSGRLRGIVVTKNVLWGAVWNFNVHTFDSARAEPLQKVGDVSLEGSLRPGGSVRPPPWHMCARAIGATVDLKVWAGKDPEPAWGDQAHGGSVALPSGWTFPGTLGWYIGHIAPRGEATFANLRTTKFVPGRSSAR